MKAEQVLEVLEALADSNCSAWLDGGWGVDALVGRQTRPHDDADVVVDLSQVSDVLRVLASLGFDLVENHLPTRAVLRSELGAQIDLHPVTFDGDGCGWQSCAAPDGSDCMYPADGFAVGVILSHAVGCLTAEVQVAHHLGYLPRPKDRLDIDSLADAGLCAPPRD